MFKHLFVLVAVCFALSCSTRQAIVSRMNEAAQLGIRESDIVRIDTIITNGERALRVRYRDHLNRSNPDTLVKDTIIK
jgi:hypothetical protein